MRRSLPAWGRNLYARRAAGDVVYEGWVLAGVDWRRRPAEAVAVGTDWRPGATDWVPVAGLSVKVVDRGGLDFDDMALLLSELARIAAPVRLFWRANGPTWAEDFEADGAPVSWDAFALGVPVPDDYLARCRIYYAARAEHMLEAAGVPL